MFIFIINILSSICACVIPAVLFTFFFVSIVEKVEKNKNIKWAYLLIAIALILSNTWGYHQGHETAIKEAELVEVQGYTYTINFNGQLHEYIGRNNYTKEVK